MGTSPKDINSAGLTSPVQANASVRSLLAQPPDTKQVDPSPIKVEGNKPLAPPSRKGSLIRGTPDYFSTTHTLSDESNPFEQSFAGGASDSNGGGARTPGGTKLPSVHALTSPAGILGSGTTPNFWGGLRSGPLSPAMLSGPQKGDYFSDNHHLSRGYTPNESSIRTGLTPGGENSFIRSGLTPGGGGSMFPEPSPNALFNPLQGGGETPGTVEFRNTAMNAMRAHPQPSEAPGKVPPAATSQPHPMSNGLHVKPRISANLDSHDNDAANGLFLLSRPQGKQSSLTQPTSAHAHPPPNMTHQTNGNSPNMAQQCRTYNGSMSPVSGHGASERSADCSDDNKQHKGPTTRNKSKRSAAQNIGRRKIDEAPSRGPAKKAKSNSGAAVLHMDPEPQSEEEPDMSKDQYNANGKKLTDEEKRKIFLERNRVAALKCRQRKKQWLANLQQKVEIFSSENDNLNAQINHLREELVNLKTLLLAHRDCPVSQQQGISGMQMQAVIEGGYSSHLNPYGMAALGH